MHTRTLKKLFLALTFWLALRVSSLHASDLTVSGNLTVTGWTDIQGNTLSLGTRTDDSEAGWFTIYTDGTTSSMEFDASRSANVWKWQQNGGGTLQLQMTLNNSNELVLYDQSSTPVAKVTLNPLGTSTIANSLTVNGTDNEMPYQSYVNSSSVLTAGLADSRYLSSSASTLVIGSSSSATGADSVAFGDVANASGTYSFASGYGSTASGNASTALGAASASGNAATAMGYSNATGGFSIAMGWGTTASGAYSMASGHSSTASGNTSTALGLAYATGDGSTAIGYNTSATAPGSTAVGWEDTATGNYSMAIGNGTTASGLGALATGYSSTASGTSSTTIGADSTASGNTSTAMGFSTSASGSYSTAAGQRTTAVAYNSFTIGTFNVGLSSIGATPSTTSWVATDPLFEIGNGGNSYGYGNPYTSAPSDALVVYKNGNAAIQGTVTTGGGITSGGVVTAQPGGDIPMYSGD